MSRRFLFFAIAGLLLGALILGLPHLLERVVETKLAERLDARGAQVSWTSLSWKLPATVELEEVEFSVADDRLRGRAGRVSVVLPWDVAFADTPRIDEVEIESADVTVDLRTSEANAPDASASDPSARSDLSEQLSRLGALRGEGIRLHVVRDGEPLAELGVDTFAVSEGGTTGRSIEARGQIDISHPRLSRLPLQPIRWSASGTMAAGHPQVELNVGAVDAERPLVDVVVPGVARLSAHRANVRAFLRPEMGVEMWLHDVAARLGSAGAPAVDLVVPEVGLSQVRGANPRVTITRPLLGVAPGKLASVRRLLAERLGRQAPAAGANSSSSDGPSRGATPASRLSGWLQRLDASVSEGRFDLRLGDDEATSREITLVDGLDASLASGKLWARGASAGGHVSLGARLEPGMLLPRVLSVQATNVRLDNLPGVKEGRTLPNRGIRGRLGGVLDVQMLLVTEGQPLLRPGPKAGVNIVTALAWKSGHLEMSGLADEPLTGIDAGVQFELEWIPALAEARLRRGRATYGPVAVAFDATLVDWPFDPVFDFEAQVDEIACQEAARALPKAMLGAYAGIEIEGEAAPTLRFHLPWHRPKKLRLELDGFVDKCHVTSLAASKSAWPKVTFARPSKPAARGLAAGQDPDQDRSQPAPTPNSLPDILGLDTEQDALAPTSSAWPTPEKLRHVSFELPEPPEDGDASALDDVLWLNRAFVKQVTEGVSDDAEVFVGPGTDAYVPMDELAPFVAGASYLSEEMEFYENHGVDLGLLQKALRIDFEGGRFVYGGSTVTQQLVKNLFLSRDKTLSRKLKEALIAWRIEDAVPKWRVLELYLNCIEYAQDVYGIGPAARHYFQKDARDLTPKEAVFIAILKPAPWYGDRFRKRGHTPTKHWWFNRMHEIMERLVDKGYLTQAQADAEKPYVLYWDEQGNYLADKTGEEDVGAEDSAAP